MLFHYIEPLVKNWDEFDCFINNLEKLIIDIYS